MKISTDEIEKQSRDSQRVEGAAAAGQPYEQIEAWDGVVQMDRLNDTHAVVLTETPTDR